MNARWNEDGTYNTNPFAPRYFHTSVMNTTVKGNMMAISGCKMTNPLNMLYYRKQKDEAMDVQKSMAMTFTWIGTSAKFVLENMKWMTSFASYEESDPIGERGWQDWQSWGLMRKLLRWNGTSKATKCQWQRSFSSFWLHLQYHTATWMLVTLFATQEPHPFQCTNIQVAVWSCRRRQNQKKECCHLPQT